MTVPNTLIRSPGGTNGWNSYGRSIEQIPDAWGAATFSVPAAVVGAVVGFAAAAPGASGYAHIRHGLRFAAGEVFSARTGASFGTYADGQVFRVSVGSGRVAFSVDGAPLGSEPSTYAPAAPLHLAAALYAAGDSVQAPTLAAYDVLDVRDPFTFDVEMTETPWALLNVHMPFAFDVPMSTTAVDTIDVRDAFWLDVPLSLPGVDLEVHAVNLDGFGSTSYAGYPFTSFARIGERYYGTKEGGLFELAGDTDAGEEILSTICPGKLDFGTSQNKTIAEAWIGARSECPLVCKLAAEGAEFVYEAGSYSADEIEQHRFKFGKGLKANYITPVIYNQHGADFEIDALEFAVATLSRKG